MHNLVQIEFFHLGRNQNPELADILAAAKDRVTEIAQFAFSGVEPSSRNKTVVRLYDAGGDLTLLAEESHAVDKRHAALLRTYVKSGWLTRKLLNSESRRLAARSLELKKMCLYGAIEALSINIAANNIIAIEKPNHTFRMAKKNELLEILEAAKGSYSVWLFVFEPNELFSQTNKLVARAM